MKEFQIQEYVEKNLSKVGHSQTKLKKTPLGEKIIITAFRPGLIVGKGGAAIKKLTKVLKVQFGLENPQVEIEEVNNPNLDVKIVAERIANSLERFGSNRFKGVMHKTLAEVMSAGALGVEILLAGKIPGARAKSWRVYDGYLKKCGDVAIVGVKTAKTEARLKSGIIGIQVRIMPPDVFLPDSITIKEEAPPLEQAKPEQLKLGKNVGEKKSEEKKEDKPKRARKPRVKQEKPPEEQKEEQSKEQKEKPSEGV